MAAIDTRPLIDREPRSVLMTLGFLSGLGSGLSFVVWWPREAPIHYWFPGLLFGTAVMLPFRRSLGYWWLRTIGAALICTVAYGAAIAIDLNTRHGNRPLIFSMAGMVGALICGKGFLVIIGRPWRYGALAAMTAAGAVSGLLLNWLGGFFEFGGFIFGMAIWQAAVAAPLGGLLAEVRAARSRTPLETAAEVEKKAP